MQQWPKEHEKALYIRKLCYRPNRTYTTYKTYIEEKGAENAANALLCVTRQTCFLLDRLLAQLEKSFIEEGGFSERAHRVRSKARKDHPV